MARAGDVRIIPDGLSFEEAATLARGLHDLLACAEDGGELAAGRARARSCTALAASAWRRFKSRIISVPKCIASAGSASKRSLLHRPRREARHRFASCRLRRSRDGDSLDGKGVDVVLNALAAEAIPMGLSCLAQFGRFIEIGKRDIYQNSRIPLWPLRKNASFHVVAMDAIFSGDEAHTSQHLGDHR